MASGRSQLFLHKTQGNSIYFSAEREAMDGVLSCVPPEKLCVTGAICYYGPSRTPAPAFSTAKKQTLFPFSKTRKSIITYM